MKAAFDELLRSGLVEEEARSGASSYFRPSAIQHHPPSADEHHPPMSNSTTPRCQSAPPPSADEHHKGTPVRKHNLKNSKEGALSSDGLEFAIWFKGTLSEKINLKPGWQESFAKIYDDLIRLDARPPDEIRSVCEWARSDPFWNSNFLSPKKLRSRNKDGVQYYDVFDEKMKSQGKSVTSKTPDLPPWEKPNGSASFGDGYEVIPRRPAQRFNAECANDPEDIPG